MSDKAEHPIQLDLRSWLSDFAVMQEHRCNGSLFRITRCSTSECLKSELNGRACVVESIAGNSEYHRAFVLVEWWPNEAVVDHVALLRFEGMKGCLRLACTQQALIVSFDDLFCMVAPDLREIAREELWGGINEFVVDRSGRVLVCGELRLSIFDRNGATLLQWDAPDVITGWNIGEDHIEVQLFDDRTERVELPDATGH